MHAPKGHALMHHPKGGAYGAPKRVPHYKSRSFYTYARVREDPTLRVGAHVAIMAKIVAV